MGEINKILHKGRFSKSDIQIELNHPSSDFSSEKIHIQTDKFRYELTKQEFRLLASGILSANANLKTYKK